jgi:hypothetical protein
MYYVVVLVGSSPNVVIYTLAWHHWMVYRGNRLNLKLWRLDGYCQTWKKTWMNCLFFLPQSH